MRAVYLVIYNCFIHHVICGIAKLLQVINFNTICLQNEVLYECIDDEGIVQWDVTQSSSTTSLFTYSYSRFGGTANYTKRIGSSSISAQLIFRNSTILSSILTITNVTSLRDSIITCNKKLKVYLTDISLQGVSGTMYILTYYYFNSINSNLNDNSQWNNIIYITSI